jgi:hypothetical protein
MDIINALFSFLMTFPSVRVIVNALLYAHHSVLGRTLEPLIINKIDSMLADAGATKTVELVDSVYKEIKDL